MDYKIYYGDGTTFTGRLDDAPPLNVAAIASIDESEPTYNMGRFVLHAMDYYLYSEDCGKWIGVSGLPDLIDHLLHTKILKVLKGRTIKDSIYHEIVRIATTDPDFPPKSARSDRLETGDN